MRRLSSFVIAAVCLTLVMSATCLAAIDEQPSTLTVTVKYGETPLGGLHIAIWQVAEAKEVVGGIVYTATAGFSGTGADFTNLTTERSIALAENLHAYATGNAAVVPPLATGVTGNDGKAVFSALPAVLYLVAQRGSSGYIIDPYIVALPGLGETTGEWNYDVISYPKSEPRRVPGQSTISVRVYKIWEGEGDHPGSVTVRLYRDGQPYGDSVTLDAGNNWSYVWENLSQSYTWSVDENPVPNGYTKVVTGQWTTGFVITNTKISGQTPPPATPGGTPPPVEPVETPEIPLGPPQTPGMETMAPPTMPLVPPPGDTPKTGDDSNAALWVVVLICASLGVAVIIRVSVSKRRIR